MVTCSVKDTAIGLGVFFTPSVLATIYAYFKGKGNLSDGFSRMLTEVTLPTCSLHASACCRAICWGSIQDRRHASAFVKASKERIL